MKTSVAHNEVHNCVSVQDRCEKWEQLFLGVSAAGQALEDHCMHLDGEAARLQDYFDEEHALRLRLQVPPTCILLFQLHPWLPGQC